MLTPVRRGNLGCISLNKQLQETLNPPREDLNEKKFGERIFRENDKVMQIRNNYQLGWRKRRDFSEGEVCLTVMWVSSRESTRRRAK